MTIHLLNMYRFLPVFIQVIIFFHVLKKGKLQLAYDLADFASHDIEYLLFAAHKREAQSLNRDKAKAKINLVMIDINQANKDIAQSLLFINSDNVSEGLKTEHRRNIKHTYKAIYCDLVIVREVCEANNFNCPDIPFPLNQFVSYEY